MTSCEGKQEATEPEPSSPIEPSKEERGVSKDDIGEAGRTLVDQKRSVEVCLVEEEENKGEELKLYVGGGY